VSPPPAESNIGFKVTLVEGSWIGFSTTAPLRKGSSPFSNISLSDLDVLRKNAIIAAKATRPNNPPARAIYTGVLTIAGAGSTRNEGQLALLLAKSFFIHIDFLTSETCTQLPVVVALISFNGHHKQ